MDHGNTHGNGSFGHFGHDGANAHLSFSHFHHYDHAWNGHDTVEGNALFISHLFGNQSQNFVTLDAGTTSNFEFHSYSHSDGPTFASRITNEKKQLAIVVVGHERIDLEALTRGFFRRHGMIEWKGMSNVPAPPLRDNYDGIEELCPARRGRPAQMPDGYYPGARGCTSRWRSYWQMAESQSVLSKILGTPLRFGKFSTWVGIDILSIYYFRGYCETRISISTHEYFRRNALEERQVHREKARLLANTLLLALKGAPCSPDIQTFLAQLIEEKRRSDKIRKDPREVALELQKREESERAAKVLKCVNSIVAAARQQQNPYGWQYAQIMRLDWEESQETPGMWDSHAHEWPADRRPDPALFRGAAAIVWSRCQEAGFSMHTRRGLFARMPYEAPFDCTSRAYFFYIVIAWLGTP